VRIVLTGASSGIGRYLAETLASAHQVWGIARRESVLQRLQDELGSHFVFSAADVADWEAMAACADEVKKVWKGIDALICCAGIVTPVGPAMQADPRQWSDSVRVNLDGTYYPVRVFYDLLQSARPRAKIVCFSGGGATGPRANFSAYASAKSGVVRLVESLSHEWRDGAVDINAVAPGAIPTQMTEAVIDAGPGLAGDEEYESALAQQGDREDALGKVGELVQYLLSSASDRISGKLISALWDPWDDFDQHKDRLADSDIYTLRRIVPTDRGESW